MNPIVERLRGLDYNRKLTSLRERNGNIEFLGSVARSYHSYTILFVIQFTIWGLLQIGLQLGRHIPSRLINVFEAIGSLRLTFFLAAIITFIVWSLLRKTVRFAVDTRAQKIVVKAPRKSKRISLEKIDYVLAFREFIEGDKNSHWGGYVAIVDRQGRAILLSSYDSLETAESDAAALARLCHLPCLCLGKEFNAQELWYISEPHEMYFGETRIAEKLQRGRGVTQGRLAPFAQRLYQPNPNGETAISNAAMVISPKSSVELTTSTTAEGQQTIDVPQATLRHYATEEPQQVLQQGR